jgi:phospholipid/cholesterol/gamma-HCH transport system substrate-binding protein
MENKSHALVAGLFTVILGIALALAAMWLSRDHTERIDYELVTRGSVSGLAPESAVRFRGVDIGKVGSIRFDPDHLGQILVRISVDKGAPVTRSTYAQLAYQGVTGLSYVQLDDDGKDLTPLPTSPDHVAQIPIQPGLLDKLSGGSEALLIGMQETISRVNLLLAPENQTALRSALQSLDSAAASTHKLSEELGPALARLPATIDDARVTLAAVTDAARSYERLSMRLQDKDGTLVRLSEGLDEFNQGVRAVNSATLPRLNALTEDAQHTAQAVTRAVDRLDEQPQSLLFGISRAIPGPGEPGFVFPR